MKKMFLFFIILSLFITLTNTQSIFIIENAVENPSSKKNVLSFIIKAGINENINSDINFQIESEFFENDKYLKDEKIECTIPKTLDVSFGTKIDIKCSINLYDIDCLKSNKVKFTKFIKKDNLFIDDRNKNILDKYLTFEKRSTEKEKEKKFNDIKTDYEFTADKVIYIQLFNILVIN